MKGCLRVYIEEVWVYLSEVVVLSGMRKIIQTSKTAHVPL